MGKELEVIKFTLSDDDTIYYCLSENEMIEFSANENKLIHQWGISVNGLPDAALPITNNKNIFIDYSINYIG